jgi:Alkylmercury lyase
MLFFRSEDALDEWCKARQHPRRPTVTLPQLWQMAVAWYANRLSPQARRPDANEIRQIFARIGLTDPFWDPRADRF